MVKVRYDEGLASHIALEVGGFASGERVQDAQVFAHVPRGVFIGQAGHDAGSHGDVLLSLACASLGSKGQINTILHKSCKS